MKKEGLLILASIFLVLGCAGSPSGETKVFTTYGLQITNFTSSQALIYPGESTEIRLIVKNAGDYDTRDIGAILYNYGSLQKVEGITKSTISILLRGSSDYFFWDLRAPTTQEVQESVYNINAQVYYRYLASGYKQVAFVSESYAGDAPNVSSGSSNSDIIINISTINPIRITGNSRTFILRIQFENIGDGEVGYADISDEEITPISEKKYFLNRINITVPKNWELLTKISEEVNKSGTEESIWEKETLQDTVVYTLDYDRLTELQSTYDCVNVKETNFNYAFCRAITTEMRKLWMTRGKEAVVMFEFNKTATISDPDFIETETASAEAEYGYIINTQDTTGAVSVVFKRE